MTSKPEFQVRAFLLLEFKVGINLNAEMKCNCFRKHENMKYIFIYILNVSFSRTSISYINSFTAKNHRKEGVFEETVRFDCAI